MKENKKIKYSNLKELIGKCFQNFKSQISKSLDSVCLSMIDRISNAYLSNSGVMNAYKKIK